MLRKNSESGFAHLLLLLAVIGVMGLMVMSNLHLMNQLSAAKSQVLGAATTSGEEGGEGVNQIAGVVQSLIHQVVQFVSK